jgi:hypothetical protein
MALARPGRAVAGDIFKEVALEYIERRRRENLAVPTMIKKKWLLEFACARAERIKH